MQMGHEAFEAWLRDYFRAWVSNDPADVVPLFTEDAVYFTGPFREPWHGRETIVATWVSDPWAQRDVETAYEVLAVRGDIGIAHWRVSYTPAGQPDDRVELDGVLVLRFAPDGRCREHREWFDRRRVPDC